MLGRGASRDARTSRGAVHQRGLVKGWEHALDPQRLAQGATRDLEAAAQREPSTPLTVGRGEQVGPGHYVAYPD